MKFIVVCVVVSFSLTAFASEGTVKKVPDDVRRALWRWECRGKHISDPDNAKNISENANGRYQIRPIYVADVNKRFKTAYKAEDCLGNREVSEDILDKYMSIYATVAWLGHEPTVEDYSRLHNGGPYGPFEGGAVDCRGTLHPDQKMRAKIAALQERTKVYAQGVISKLGE